jgi:hypothetical protein
MSDARAKHRVGEDPDAVELDEDGAVSDPRDPQHTALHPPHLVSGHRFPDLSR